MEKVLEYALRFSYLRKSDNYTLGALGLILLENIRREWICSVSTTQLEPFFRTMNVNPVIYYELYKVNDKRLPLGLITLQNSDFNMKYDQRKFSKDMNFVYFCHPTTEMKWYDYWLRSRRAWWTKYLRHPDLIAQKTLGEDSVSLELRLPSISIELESVSRLGSSFFDDAEDIQQYMINGKKSVMPSVIKITSSSHQGFLAILADACSLRSLKKNSMDKSCVFQIHHLLAPWKVGFALPLEKVSSGQPLYELAILLSSELKSLRIDVAPFKLGSTDSSTKWFDGAGVPFSVLLSPETLKNGICSLRTRDTTLSEQVHVGSLKQHLGKFLIPNLYASKLK